MCREGERPRRLPPDQDLGILYLKEWAAWFIYRKKKLLKEGLKVRVYTQRPPNFDVVNAIRPLSDKPGIDNDFYGGAKIVRPSPRRVDSGIVDFFFTISL
jgi:hypothetical protein